MAFGSAPGSISSIARSFSAGQDPHPLPTPRRTTAKSSVDTSKYDKQIAELEAEVSKIETLYNTASRTRTEKEIEIANNKSPRDKLARLRVKREGLLKEAQKLGERRVKLEKDNRGVSKVVKFLLEKGTPLSEEEEKNFNDLQENAKALKANKAAREEVDKELSPYVGSEDALNIKINKLQKEFTELENECVGHVLEKNQLQNQIAEIEKLRRKALRESSETRVKKEKKPAVPFRDPPIVDSLQLARDTAASSSSSNKSKKRSLDSSGKSSLPPLEMREIPKKTEKKPTAAASSSSAAASSSAANSSPGVKKLKTEQNEADRKKQKDDADNNPPKKKTAAQRKHASSTAASSSAATTNTKSSPASSSSSSSKPKKQEVIEINSDSV